MSEHHREEDSRRAGRGRDDNAAHAAQPDPAALIQNNGGLHRRPSATRRASRESPTRILVGVTGLLLLVATLSLLAGSFFGPGYRTGPRTSSPAWSRMQQDSR